MTARTSGGRRFAALSRLTWRRLHVLPAGRTVRCRRVAVRVTGPATQQPSDRAGD